MDLKILIFQDSWAGETGKIGERNDHSTFHPVGVQKLLLAFLFFLLSQGSYICPLVKALNPQKAETLSHLHIPLLLTHTCQECLLPPMVKCSNEWTFNFLTLCTKFQSSEPYSLFCFPGNLPGRVEGRSLLSAYWQAVFQPPGPWCSSFLDARSFKSLWLFLGSISVFTSSPERSQGLISRLFRM